MIPAEEHRHGARGRRGMGLGSIAVFAVLTSGALTAQTGQNTPNPLGQPLLDASGDVRWQDVSHEPFTEIDFLLKEAKRLLANDSAKTEVGAK